MALYMILFMVIVILPFYIGYFIISNVSFGKYQRFYYSILKYDPKSFFSYFESLQKLFRFFLDIFILMDTKWFKIQTFNSHIKKNIVEKN